MGDFIPLKTNKYDRRQSQIIPKTTPMISKSKNVAKKRRKNLRTFDSRLGNHIVNVKRKSGTKIRDVDEMVSLLQREYPEYRRKKKNAFSILVNDVILKMESSEIESDDTKDQNLDTSEISGDDIDFVEYPDSNLVNNSLTDLYKKNGPSKNNERQLAEGPKDKKMDCDKEPSKEVPKVPKTPKKKKEITLQNSNVTFADIGGIEDTLLEICKLLVHMKHPEIYQSLGVIPPRGFLLHGPPGSGKTHLAHAIAGELELPFIKIAATEIVSGVSGESEERVRDIFEKAVSSAPCLLFIDEIDAITPKRETALREMERRIVAQLLTCLDDLNQKDATTQVLVIGATNRPDSLDPALRRAGRFDREISLGIPNEAARSRILKVLCKKLKLRSDFDYLSLAHQTPGYVGADLMALSREAATCAINRTFEELNVLPNKKLDDKVQSAMNWLEDIPPLTEEQLQNLYIEQSDFENALKSVQPSAKREGFATVPDTTWNDVGALKNIREELQLAILAPVNHREMFEKLGLSSSGGILLCGPPGCGKTLLAKAIANESGINFISVKGPELINMYVGESERAVRQCFQRARNSAPCVIFFDELDALCPRRNESAESGSSARVVNQLLTEMDGLESRKQVFVLAATNRPDIIDPAMLRPGRLDKVLFVGLPSPDDREDILRTLTKNGTKPPLKDVDLRQLAYDARCNCFTGADLAALVREASVTALRELFLNREAFTSEMLVTTEHFNRAFDKVKPSVSDKDQKLYERMTLKYSTQRFLEDQ